MSIQRIDSDIVTTILRKKINDDSFQDKLPSPNPRNLDLSKENILQCLKNCPDETTFDNSNNSYDYQIDQQISCCTDLKQLKDKTGVDSRKPFSKFISFFACAFRLQGLTEEPISSSSLTSIEISTNKHAEFENENKSTLISEKMKLTEKIFDESSSTIEISKEKFMANDMELKRLSQDSILKKNDERLNDKIMENYENKIRILNDEIENKRKRIAVCESIILRKESTIQHNKIIFNDFYEKVMELNETYSKQMLELNNTLYTEMVTEHEYSKQIDLLSTFFQKLLRHKVKEQQPINKQKEYEEMKKLMRSYRFISEELHKMLITHLSDNQCENIGKHLKNSNIEKLMKMKKKHIPNEIFDKKGKMRRMKNKLDMANCFKFQQPKLTTDGILSNMENCMIDIDSDGIPENSSIDIETIPMNNMLNHLETYEINQDVQFLSNHFNINNNNERMKDF
ncbi:hypothetical protein SNEBB_009339 [Seison nebaliae]|nr:hypothetical protein SNEBB_009339 [Seison nebaliae]